MQKVKVFNTDFYLLIDNDDFDRVKKHRWYKVKTNNKVYFKTYIDRKLVSIHRFILGINDSSIQVDHIDGNTSNNQKSNLRVCNAEENARNRRVSNKSRKRKKGVYFCKIKDKKYIYAKIIVNGKVFYLGYFKTINEAAKAYDEEAKKYFGEFAWLNFPKK